MTITFPATDARTADVVGARPAACPITGAEAIELALQVDGEDPQVLSLTMCGAYHLRQVLDAALDAPYFWDDEDKDDGALVAPIRALLGVEPQDPGRPQSVRWDEGWADPRSN